MAVGGQTAARAADGDFVIALYNPASKARPGQIFEAFTLLRAWQVVGGPLSSSPGRGGRPDERIVITTLGDADPGLADMSTLVLIGSSGTKLVPRPDGHPFVYTRAGRMRP